MSEASTSISSTSDPPSSPSSSTQSQTSTSTTTSTTQQSTTTTTSTTSTSISTTTLESTVFVTTTNAAGSTFTSAPSEITSFLTSTNSNGGVVTVTQIGVNPTLSPNNDNNDGSSFFHNTGAVAGVINSLWILFAIRRRRRTRRLEHDTAVNATLAAVGFHRAPLEDEDDDHGATGNLRFGSPEMAQHSPRSSIPTIPTTGRTSAYLNDVNIESGFNPYAEMGAYGPPQSPPLMSNARNASDHRISHSASHSAGSYEPLLAFYNSQNETAMDKSPVLAQSGLPGERSSAASSYSTQDTGDDRLDPDLRRRLKDDNDAEKGDLRDDEDYSRPVLGVRRLLQP
ncbi:hypothetical protein BDZ89DRAFT_1099749 [Hymenopellis radicata]|nr:hypothetical protein BDZ89DRAFT_1099749 [Hymenopellis radicata]